MALRTVGITLTQLASAALAFRAQGKFAPAVHPPPRPAVSVAGSRTHGVTAMSAVAPHRAAAPLGGAKATKHQILGMLGEAGHGASMHWKPDQRVELLTEVLERAPSNDAMYDNFEPLSLIGKWSLAYGAHFPDVVNDHLKTLSLAEDVHVEKTIEILPNMTMNEHIEVVADGVRKVLNTATTLKALDPHRRQRLSTGDGKAKYDVTFLDDDMFVWRKDLDMTELLEDVLGDKFKSSDLNAEVYRRVPEKKDKNWLLGSHLFHGQ